MGFVDKIVLVFPATHDSITRYAPTLITILRNLLPSVNIEFTTYTYYRLADPRGVAYSYTANLYSFTLHSEFYQVLTQGLFDPSAGRRSRAGARGVVHSS